MGKFDELISNMRGAYHNRRITMIDGGEFGPQELRAAADTLEQCDHLREVNAELLAALEELLEHVEWRRRIAKEKTGPHDVTHRARAAIAKARGSV